MNAVQSENRRLLAQKGPYGCQLIGSESDRSRITWVLPKLTPARGLTHGDPGIHNCIKLPRDSTATNFGFGVMLKPNLWSHFQMRKARPGW